MRILYTTLIVVLLDQLSKFLVKGFPPFISSTYSGITHHPPIRVIGDFFRLTFVENPGMAFGIGVNPTIKMWVAIFTIFASIGLVMYLYSIRRQSFSMRFAVALILGGAIGNLIDRLFYGVIYHYAPLFYGRVVDFLEFEFPDVTLFGRTYERFPVFNIADSAVTIGVLILIFFYKKHQNESEINLVPAGEPALAESAQDSTENNGANNEIASPTEIAEQQQGSEQVPPVMPSTSENDEQSDNAEKILL